MVNWELIGVGVVVFIAVIGANAWVMKLVIDNAVLKALKEIGRDYVLKEDFDRHVDQCHVKLAQIKGLQEV